MGEGKRLVAFPHLGNNWAAFKSLFENAGVDVYVPGKNNARGLEHGLKLSPEWVCLPFKITIANFIEALENGVKTIVMASDCGPCRFGFYHAVQEKILKDLGYDVEIKCLPQADLLTFEWAELLQSIRGTRPPLSRLKLLWVARIFFMKLQLIQLAEKLEGETRCHEVCRGETTKALERCLKAIDEAGTHQQLRGLKRRIKEEFTKVERTERKKIILKVVLAGEIFVALDSFANQDLKKKLGELGCEVRMGISLYDWVKHKAHVNFHRKYLEYLSKSHGDIGGLKLDIGGEAFWVLGQYIDFSRGGVDGFVHVYPFTCMPEITAKSIITKWYHDGIFDLPPLFLGFDEHVGEAGLVTRLEAYTDLLRTKKKKLINGD